MSLYLIIFHRSAMVNFIQHMVFKSIIPLVRIRSITKAELLLNEDILERMQTSINTVGSMKRDKSKSYGNRSLTVAISRI